MSRRITFQLGEGIHLGWRGGREWRAKQMASGWYRLAFRDTGEDEWTNAGLHPTKEQALEEAKK